MTQLLVIVPIFFLSVGAACASMGTERAVSATLPFFFEPIDNRSSATTFVLRRSNWTARVGPTSAHFALGGTTSYKMTFLGANSRAEISGIERLPGTTSYLLGNSRSDWRVGVPQYARVATRQAYPGIDVIFYGRYGTLEYDFRVAPGVDPGQIRMRLEGVDGLCVTSDGDLAFNTGHMTLKYDKPVAYQWKGDRRVLVEVSYRIDPQRIVRFALGEYDRGLPLVIDPALNFSTYVGGTMADSAAGIAVDSGGYVYVVGSTQSTDFPTRSPIQAGKKGTGTTSRDVFVAKLDPSTSQIVYSTYLGSSGDDWGSAIAVDASGNAYITGAAGASDFPLSNSLQTSFGGSQEAFVAKLNPAGTALEYSTFIGGSGADFGKTLAIDGNRNVYMAGWTASGDFPLRNAYQASIAGSFDIFLSKLDPTGSSLVFSTYFGGDAEDHVEKITVDAAGKIYLVGKTASSNFPTVNAAQTAAGASSTSPAAFVLKFNNTGSGLVYSTCLGTTTSLDVGMGSSAATAVAADTAGNAYVTGWTNSDAFPLINPIQNTRGRTDCFVTKLASSGALVFSTYFGSGGEDRCIDLALDSSARIVITGDATTAADFPLINPIQSNAGPIKTGILATLENDGTKTTFSSFLGAADGQTDLTAVAVHSSGQIYVAGTTWGAKFPTVFPIQPSKGAIDVVVSRFLPDDVCSYAVSPTAYPVAFPPTGGYGTISVAAPGGCDWNAVSHTLLDIIGPNTSPYGGALGCCGTYYAGSGAGSVSFRVNQFTGGPDRSFDFVVAGQRVTVTQNGYGCPYQIVPYTETMIGAAGGTRSFSVVTNSGCPYLATSNDGWITVLAPASGRSGGVISYSVTPNTTRSQRQGTISVQGLTFTIRQEPSLTGTTATAVIRDIWGDLAISTYALTSLKKANGIVASDPGVAQNASGDTFVVARDIRNAVWVNTWNATSESWAGWVYAGGTIDGTPAITVAPSGTAYFFARGAVHNGYWIKSYTPGSGLGSWIHLGGVFATDPAVAGAPDGSIYIAGTDSGNNVWSGRYTPGSGFAGWQASGGIVKGKVSIAAGKDNAAYITARDAADRVWIGRVQGNTWTGWFLGGGAVAQDPQIAATGNGKLFVSALGAGGAVWYQAFNEGAGNGWQGWTFTNGWLQGVSPAAVNNELYLAGRDSNNGLWWYHAATNQWTWIGNQGLATGHPAAAPR